MKKKTWERISLELAVLYEKIVLKEKGTMRARISF